MRYSEYFPPLEWYSRVNKNTVAADAYAGLINAALVLPQGVAFATIAGLPPQYGLYTAIITAIVAALFGSSMIMISGPTTAISAVLFTTLSDFAAPGTAQYIEMALTLTILVGLFQIAGGFARLGGLVSFVSHSVMTAFTMAAALLIAVSQLAGVTGLVVEKGGNIAERLMRLAEHWDEINLYALLIAGTTLALAVIMQKFTPKLPGFLIALLAGSALAYGIDAVNHGVEMVGALPSMMPQLAPPSPTVREVVQLAPGAAAIAVVGALEAISIGRAFAVRRRESFDTSQEMIGQGLSNVVGGFFQCYAGSGSFTRSGVNATAGAVTPLSGIFASGFLLLILLFIAPWVAYIPKPAMAGLILLVAYRLIEFSELRHIITSSRPETVILVLTLAAGLFIELDFAIYVGVIASLCVFIYESSHPELPVTAPVLQPDGTRKFRNVEHQGVTECPQLMIFRLDGPLYFGSVENVAKAYKKNCARDPRQIHKILYMKGVGKTDLAGADFLIQAIRDAKAEGGSFRIVALFPPLVDSLYRFHVIDELGEENLHSNKSDAVSAAMNDLSRNICEGCLRDVFWECDNVMRRDD
ncbi:SulP family inorganic anion transporter [Neptunicoccus cionae]|uniref:SulP family inorganic anion transporter n=1 Tax=Neptunicoccus cionae TaxID=2035344 RepID=UPI000C75A9AE|nr:SulP family inorganic anion transporter [Amylibacter cionae]PLS21699.1 SulP family inorganic anion transporter [Amylibacter cionae]